MSTLDDLQPWIQRASDFYEVWIEGKALPRRDIDTPRGLLRFLNSVGGRLLEVGYFVGVALRQTFLPGSLALLIGAVFFLSRHSAEAELDLADKSFPRNRLPEQWSGKRDVSGITISVVAFFALYVAMAWVSGRIAIVSLMMLSIACIDFNTRRLIRKRTMSWFEDDRYAPHPGDDDRLRVERTRDVIRGFLDRPHGLKEGLRIAGCALAFGVGVCGHRFGWAWAEPAAYLCLITTLLANEIVTGQWRGERDHQLRAIEGLETKPLNTFSIPIWTVSVIAVLLCAMTAWSEGHLTSPSVTIGFLNHGGMWGDFVILPLINGMVVPRLPRLTATRSLRLGAMFALAVVLTIIAHQQWDLMGQTAGVTDHIFPSHGRGVWYRDLSVAGYLHVVYMSVEVTLLLAYALTRMPGSTVMAVTFLLTVHVVVGQVQPALYSTGIFLTTRTMLPTVASILFIWLIGLVKIRHRTSW